MTRLRSLWITALLCAPLPGFAEEAGAVDEIADLLQGRWYETEIIIFERLPVIDTNNAEQLALTRARSWPHNMIEVAPAGDRSAGAAVAAESQTDPQQLSPEEIRPLIVAALETSTEQCRGFLEAIYAEEGALQRGAYSAERGLRGRESPGERDLRRRTSSGEAASRSRARGRARFEPAPLPDPIDTVHPALAAVLSLDAITLNRSEQVLPLPGVPPFGELVGPAPAPPPEVPQLEPREIHPSPLLALLGDVAAFEDELRSTNFAWLPDASLTLGDAVRAINRQRHLRPVFHGRWRQQVPPRDAPLPIHFAAEVTADAPATQTGFAKIEGTIALTVARYLHFAPDLWYHADALGLEPIAMPLTRDIEIEPAPAYMELKESRRMRSGDLHYIDHPKFGIVVRIEPIEIPAELTASWEALVALQSDDVESDPPSPTE